MKQTAIKELIEKHSDSFCEAGYYFEFITPSKAVELLEVLQAKHDEELKQAVIDAHKAGFQQSTNQHNYQTAQPILKDALEYYKSNHP